MFTKKKASACTTAEISIKLQSKQKSTIKTHSRGCSLGSTLINPTALILLRFHQSSKQMNERQSLHNIDSLIFSRSSSFSVSTRETLLTQCDAETLKHYYIFKKHQEGGRGRPVIETQLVEAIRGRFGRQVERPFPHFEAQIYPIMKKHSAKSKHFRKIVHYLQQNQSVQNPKAMPQQFPTASSDQDSAKAYEQVLQRAKGPSDSFQLRALTQCIRQMFSKQNLQKNQLGISLNRDNSWLGPNKNESKKQFIDCDFSSIEAHSKFDLMIESKHKFKKCSPGSQSNYGLQDLKRKFVGPKVCKSSKNEQKSRPFGHKRNPTDVMPQKKSDFYGNPMTPKQQAARSEFGSSDNIPIQPLTKKRPQKQKQREVNEPYMLKFEKKKTEKKEKGLKGFSKQNMKTQHGRSKQEEIRSKSRSLKKSVLQPRKKRVPAQP